MNEPKNYSPLRFSKSFGQSSINLGFNKADFLKWAEACEPDAKGNIKFSICPRKSPSETNAFTMFQDTWKPDLSRQNPPSPRPASAIPALTKIEQDDVPF